VCIIACEIQNYNRVKLSVVVSRDGGSLNRISHSKLLQKVMFIILHVCYNTVSGFLRDLALQG
jgi:hypothetical protein